MLQRGDLLLFRGTKSLWDRMICLATGGPFCHCEIVLDPDRTLGATLKGIGIHNAPQSGYDVVDLSLYTSADKITEGLLWALQQRNRAYGWSDIFFQAIKFLFPNNPLRWGIEGRWDCSDYVTRYLQQAGVTLPEELEDPYCNTPNDLGRWAGLIPTKEAVHG